jgi:hypothetical protein
MPTVNLHKYKFAIVCVLCLCIQFCTLAQESRPVTMYYTFDSFEQYLCQEIGNKQDSVEAIVIDRWIITADDFEYDGVVPRTHKIGILYKSKLVDLPILATSDRRMSICGRTYKVYLPEYDYVFYFNPKQPKLFVDSLTNQMELPVPPFLEKVRFSKVNLSTLTFHPYGTPAPTKGEYYRYQRR